MRTYGPDKLPLRAQHNTEKDLERRRHNEILARYEASKRSGETVAAPGEGRGDSPPALPSSRCKLCPVSQQYPRLCGSCVEKK